jgi:hypothetical protein
VLTARGRQRRTKLRRKMRSARGVEIEVPAADLGEPRAPQEILAFTEERRRPVAMDLDISPRRCLKLDRDHCGAPVHPSLQD